MFAAKSDVVERGLEKAAATRDRSGSDDEDLACNSKVSSGRQTPISATENYAGGEGGDAGRDDARHLRHRPKRSQRGFGQVGGQRGNQIRRRGLGGIFA